MESTKSYMLGMFIDEEHMMNAAGALKDSKINILDIYTPFPVHGLDEYLDIKRSRLPYVTFIGCITGLVAAMYFQIWTSTASWPINVGGKPHNSFIAFLPVAFEIMVLFGALLTVFAFLVRAKFYPGKEAEIIDLKITDNHFVVCVECSSAVVNSEKVKMLFEKHGATEIKAMGVIQ